ncbi:hypothetical protein M413DRAFT_21288 [Hebeloma cylindrosporum]|uniref:PhoD-like phosphatase metallophosphatase domain-containing protein n=1 Tax=Hebeloma cylindrosporum TaxID=76867 RepID=A0A0C3CJT8_HEBCY|nr:hypothetical protein M413DRAFT_21288 [Hebeloma cylindrosporum h7]
MSSISSPSIAKEDHLAFSPFFDPAHDISFSRVGAVYPDAAKIVVRAPFQYDFLHILYRDTTTPDLPWIDGPPLNLLPQNDWAHTVRLDNLWPSTPYEYVLATSNRSILPDLSQPVRFRTFPDPRLNSNSHFRFIASSCITPNFPYNGPLNRFVISGFDLLAHYLSHPSNSITHFMLFLGDFIYADVPIYFGDHQEAYRRLYRRNYQSPSFKKVYQHLPIIHAYDDHEFINNYVGNAQDLPPFKNASNAYNLYAGDANYDSSLPDQHFFDFQHGDVAFFVMDTRRYRTPPSQHPSTMLGDLQLSALHKWLHKVNHTSSFKFIVSSVPFTSLWTHDAQIDSWAAYPAEKASLLAAFQSVPNVVIISGDRHEFASIEFSPENPNPPSRQRNLHQPPQHSDAAFTRNGSEQLIPYEKVVAYLPNGNSKWSTFELDTRDVTKPTLRIETVIDGKPAYHLEIIGAPARLASFTGLGSLVATNVKDLFDKFGLSSPGKWF